MASYGDTRFCGCVTVSCTVWAFILPHPITERDQCVGLTEPAPLVHRKGVIQPMGVRKDCTVAPLEETLRQHTHESSGSDTD